MSQKTKRTESVIGGTPLWLKLLCVSFMAFTVYSSFFLKPGYSPVIGGARRDARDLCVLIALCTLLCDFMPSARRIRCVMIYKALKWTLYRSCLRETLRDGKHGPVKRRYLYARMVVLSWAAKSTARNVHRVLATYNYAIDLIALVGGRWRKDSISINVLDVDHGLPVHLLDEFMPKEVA